jgi:LEA14-like dessication related protein
MSRAARPLLLLAIVLAGAGCTALTRALRTVLEPPRALFQTAELSAIDLDAATIAAHFRLENPNPVALPLDNLRWAFHLDGTKVLEGTLDERVRLAPNGATPLTVPIRVPFAALPALLTTLAAKAEAPYLVEGRAAVRTPLGELGFPLRFEGLLPIPKVPMVSFTSARLTGLTPLGATFSVALAVTNPNVFPLPLQALAAKVSVAQQPLATVGLDAPRPLPAGGTVELSLPVTVSFAGSGLALLSALQSGGARVALDGEARVAGRRLPVDLATTLSPR